MDAPRHAAAQKVVPNTVAAEASTPDDLHPVLQMVISRRMTMLTGPGVLVEDMGQTWGADPDAE